MRPPLPGRMTRHGAFGAPRRRADGSGRRHNGLDLYGKPGSVAVAPISGTVIAAEGRQVRPWRGYAPVVAILSPDRDRLHLVSHLQPAMMVKAGDRVTEGQAIGRVGKLAHVHWEIRHKGQPIDPADQGAQWWKVAAAIALGWVAGRALS